MDRKRCYTGPMYLERIVVYGTIEIKWKEFCREEKILFRVWRLVAAVRNAYNYVAVGWLISPRPLVRRKWVRREKARKKSSPPWSQNVTELEMKNTRPKTSSTRIILEEERWSFWSGGRKVILTWHWGMPWSRRRLPRAEASHCTSRGWRSPHPQIAVVWGAQFLVGGTAFALSLCW